MILDANVLLYAVDEQSHFHTPALAWLDEAMNGVERVGFPWVSLTAFQRIITHPRATANPLTPTEAWDIATYILDLAVIHMPYDDHGQLERSSGTRSSLDKFRTRHPSLDYSRAIYPFTRSIRTIHPELGPQYKSPVTHNS